MYCDFYQLRERPFNVTADPKFLYLNACYREALASLHYGVTQRKGFITLIGEAGTGKTTLLKKLLDELDENTRTVFLFNTNVTFDEILEYVFNEFDLPVHNGKRLYMLQRLNAFLLEELHHGRNVALLVDEAQDLDYSVMEDLRLLSNLETSKEKILQIVLSGQPELGQKLGNPGLRQLRQRVAINCRLQPLARDEVTDYIQARLNAAGAADTRLFTRDAEERIYEVSKGIPRVVNVVCDNALVIGYALGKKRIGADTINEAAVDLFPPETRPAAREEAAPAAPPASASAAQVPSIGTASGWRGSQIGMIVGVAVAILIGLFSVGRTLWKGDAEGAARTPAPKVPLEVVAPAQRKAAGGEAAPRKALAGASDGALNPRPLVREAPPQPESRAAETVPDGDAGRDRRPAREYAALPPAVEARVVDVRERLPSGASVAPVKPLDPKQVAREREERLARERALQAQREREENEARQREELAAREAQAARERAAVRAAEEENARRAAADAAVKPEAAAPAAEPQRRTEPVVDWQDKGRDTARAGGAGESARPAAPADVAASTNGGAAETAAQGEAEDLAVAVLERSKLAVPRPVEAVASLDETGAAPGATVSEQVARAAVPAPEPPAGSPPAAVDEVAAPAEQIVTARPGDSISLIAIQKYGAANHTVLDLLKMANPSVRDIDRISVGQQLRVPQLDEGVAVVRQEKGDYAVLVLSTPDQRRANGIEAAMRKRGFHAEVRRTDFGNGRNVYRLVMPGFRDRASAVSGGKQLQRLIREDDQFANMAR